MGARRDPIEDGLPEWLPPTVSLTDYEGAWSDYLEALYQVFKQDFLDSRPPFRGKRVGLKKHPLLEGKEATFWHFITEGRDETSRTPDMRRCERIGWIRPIIENCELDPVKVWMNERNGKPRICLWLECAEFLVILEDRRDYVLPWSAYPVTEKHRIDKLEKEYREYLLNTEKAA